MSSFRDRARPTAEQFRRAKIADRLFGLHNDINKLLGGIAMAIIDGADAEAAVTILRRNLSAITTAALDNCDEIRRQEGL